MRTLYTLLVTLLAPIVFVRSALRGVRDRLYRDRLAERFGYTRLRFTTPTLWVHTVSVGEVQAAAPLIRELLKRFPQYPLIVTTATPTGAARVQAMFGEHIHHCYLPYDTPGSVRRFLQRIRPRMAIIVETELWPNLYGACARADIPIIVVSARISPRSFPRYRRFAPYFKNLFDTVTVAAQTPDDAQRFRAIGAKEVQVSGNIKFDIELPATTIDAGRQFRTQQLADRPVWIAASTHEGEETAALDAHEQIRAQMTAALLILVPRHPQRFDEVRALLSERNIDFVARSTQRSITSTTQVLLLDTMGELVMFYAASDVAFVAGSLMPVGGHNFLEPAALGLPIVSGPHVFNAQVMSDAFFNAGAAIKVNSTAELATVISGLLNDVQRRQRMGALGKHLIGSNRGAVSRITALVEQRLVDAIPPVPDSDGKSPAD